MSKPEDIDFTSLLMKCRRMAEALKKKPVKTMGFTPKEFYEWQATVSFVDEDTWCGKTTRTPKSALQSLHDFLYELVRKEVKDLRDILGEYDEE